MAAGRSSDRWPVKQLLAGQAVAGSRGTGAQCAGHLRAVKGPQPLNVGRQRAWGRSNGRSRPGPKGVGLRGSFHHYRRRRPQSSGRSLACESIQLVLKGLQQGMHFFGKRLILESGLGEALHKQAPDQRFHFSETDWLPLFHSSISVSSARTESSSSFLRSTEPLLPARLPSK